MVRLGTGLLILFLLFTGCFYMSKYCATFPQKQNTNDVVYRFQDTIEFCDKDSNKILTKLENVEFRILNKNNIMYVVYDKDKNVVILDKLPDNSYVNISTQVMKNE
jgi:hypothetical protein